MTMSSVLKDLEKKYGKGVAIDATGENLTPDFISTGRVLFDMAIGGKEPGIPNNRIIEMYGPPAGGKCLTKDTYVLTPNGYKTIEEIFEECGIISSCSNKTIEFKYPLINKYGDIENTQAFTCNNKRKIYKITTKSGFVIKSTANHPHYTMSNIGNLIWKKASEFTLGEYLVCFRNEKHFGTAKRDRQEMYGLGCLIADGSFTQKNRIGITNDDMDIKNFIENTMEKTLDLGKLSKYKNNDKGSYNYHFNSKEKTNSFFRRYGIDIVKSNKKKIPSFVKTLDKASMKEFIKGYIDCEGYIDNDKYSMEITSASYNLVYELKLMLMQFGITSYLRSKEVKEYPNNSYYTLNIYGKNLLLYKLKIGTNSYKVDKKLRLDPPISEGLCIKNKESIPNIMELVRDLYSSFETGRKENKIVKPHQDRVISYFTLDKILKCTSGNHISSYLRDIYYLNYFYDEIVSIEEVGEEPTFDFAMSKTHSFIANSFVTHNTTLALSVAAEVQKRKQSVLFIDLEHAFSEDMARKIGIDLDSKEKFFLVHPKSGNIAMQIIEKFLMAKIETGEGPGLIIVDSVASMVAQRELDRDIGDDDIGSRAKLMSGALPRLVNLSFRAKTPIIFINQTRSKIGGYGNPETTTGGNALGFYATIRMRVSQAGDYIKVKDEILGHRVKAHIKKNKVGTPFKSAEFNLYYDRGVDPCEEVAEAAADQGIIERAGSWFSYGKMMDGTYQLKVQGISKVGEELKKDSKLFKEIKKQLTIQIEKPDAVATFGEER